MLETTRAPGLESLGASAAPCRAAPGAADEVEAQPEPQPKSPEERQEGNSSTFIQLSLNLVSLVWSGILVRVPVWLKNQDRDHIPNRVKEIRLRDNSCRNVDMYICRRCCLHRHTCIHTLHTYMCAEVMNAHRYVDVCIYLYAEIHKLMKACVYYTYICKSETTRTKVKNRVHIDPGIHL